MTIFSDISGRESIQSLRKAIENVENRFRRNAAPGSVFDENTDYVVRLLENTTTFAHLLYTAKSKSEYARAVLIFAQCRANSSLTGLVIDKWNEIMGSTLQGDDNESPFQGLKDLLSKYDSIKRLPIFIKLHRFLMYSIGLSLFDKMGVPFDPSKFLHVEKAAVKKEFHLGPDFVHCILDTIVYLLDTGYQCMRTGSVDPILHQDSAYDKWLQGTEVLRVQARVLSNPEPHGFTLFDFLSRLDDSIEKGRCIAKYQQTEGGGHRIARKIVDELELIRSDCKTKKLAQMERKAPFAVLVHGGSHVAKSAFTKMLYYHYGKLMGLPTEDEFKFTRNAFDKHWVNFNSSQWCIQLDDIAFLHPNSSQGTDPSLLELICVINNVPFVPPQAELADKGKTPVQSRFVIATTNTAHLNAEAYFACPLAVQRRLPYVITIEPKMEYSKYNGLMLDTALIPESVYGEYPDFWNIRVSKVEPNMDPKKIHIGQTAVLQEIARYTDVLDFIKWFSEVARDAATVQTRALKCDNDMKKVILCRHDIPVTCCELCASQLQSAGDDLALTPWVRNSIEEIENSMDGPDRDPGYDHTMRKIFEQISLMSVFNRLVVLWTFCVFWFMQNVKFGNIIVAFFFGRWYFYILALRLFYIPEMRHLCFHLMGHTAYRRMRTSKALVITSTILATVTVIKTLSVVYSWTNKEQPVRELQVSGTEGKAPEPAGDKKENVWYKDTFECTPFDVGPPTLSRANWTRDATCKFLSGNVASFKARISNGSEISEKRGRMVCIGGSIYLCNNHSIPYDEFELEVTFTPQKDGVNPNITVLVTAAQLIRRPQLDILLIYLPSIPPKRDIRSFFAKSSFAGRFDGELLGRDLDGELRRMNFRAPELQTIDFKEKEHVLFTSGWGYITPEPTQVGMCGSLVISYTSMGPIILGIHTIGGGSRQCYGVSITQEFLETISVPIFSSTQPTLQTGDYSIPLVPLDKKATVRYIESGTCHVFGSLGGFRGKMKSRVVPTLMCDLAKEAGYKVKTGPPIMNSYLPWRRALLDMTRPVTHIRYDVLKECRMAFTNDILSKLTEKDLKGIHVYDVNTAVNGAPGLAYVDKLNRSTSAGFPFRKSKKYFMTAVEATTEHQNPVVLDPLILEEMDRIKEKYARKELYHPVFTASLKDEPVSLKKIKESKTRVFCGAPLPWSVVVRQFYLAIVRLIQQNRFLFESGPGTIAQSKEWDELFHHLTHFGFDRIIAGDYGKFDKRMPACVILEAFEILIAIFERAGWTELHLQIALGIGLDIAYCCLDFHGILMMFFGTNPSGHPLTVIINGLANSLYMRYCYFMLNPAREVATFKSNVRIMTYGDDLIMNVSTDAPWFNHTSIQETLASIDIEFTMADKEAKSVPYIHINEATFLRRSWRFEPNLNCYVCPLEHDSIEKMLTMCVRSKTISMELQAIESMNTALREYFWYGKHVFDEKRKLFEFWVSQLSLEDYMARSFPTWEVLVAEFEENSRLRCASNTEQATSLNLPGEGLPSALGGLTSPQ
nr:MAG: hypothetical protein 1 [Marnaviridae sp.]